MLQHVHEQYWENRLLKFLELYFKGKHYTDDNVVVRYILISAEYKFVLLFYKKRLFNMILLEESI